MKAVCEGQTKTLAATNNYIVTGWWTVKTAQDISVPRETECTLTISKGVHTFTKKISVVNVTYSRIVAQVERGSRGDREHFAGISYCMNADLAL